MDILNSTAFANSSAQGTTKGVPTPFESMIENMFPLIFLFFCFYFIIIRPQAKKAKEQAHLINNMKAGDEIVTSGGIIGRVRTISKDFITIDTGGSHLKILKEHVSHATKKAPEITAKKAKVATAAKK